MHLNIYLLYINIFLARVFLRFLQWNFWLGNRTALRLTAFMVRISCIFILIYFLLLRWIVRAQTLHTLFSLSGRIKFSVSCHYRVRMVEDHLLGHFGLGLVVQFSLALVVILLRMWSHLLSCTRGHVPRYLLVVLPVKLIH